MRFDEQTVWLSQDQMSLLFQKGKSTINEHIKNIYKEGELVEEGTKSKFGNSEFADKPTFYYNLDVIISVGYRVKSKTGIQFRQWATQRLKDYLVKGYAINEKRLAEAENRFNELKQAIQLFDKLSQTKEISGSEAQGLLKVLRDFTSALYILDKYDHQTLRI